MADQSWPDPVNAPNGEQPTAFIMHHTAGRGDPASVVNFWQQQGKGYGAQYIMDRNGVVHDTRKEFGYGGSNEILNGAGQYKNLNNQNVVGMEIVANDDSDVTDAQKQAAAKFIQASYPNTPVYGHGQVNPGHKEATEGLGAVNAVLASRGQPLVQPDSATASAVPSRPATATPGVTINTSPMDLVANLESGNTNIKQGIVDANTARGTPAGGYFQIIDPTWRSYAAAAGVDVNQYPTAMSAPRDIQARVASVIPINQWGRTPSTRSRPNFPVSTLANAGRASIDSTQGRIRRHRPDRSLDYRARRNFAPDPHHARHDHQLDPSRRRRLDQPMGASGSEPEEDAGPARRRCPRPAGPGRALEDDRPCAPGAQRLAVARLTPGLCAANGRPQSANDMGQRPARPDAWNRLRTAGPAVRLRNVAHVESGAKFRSNVDEFVGYMNHGCPNPI